MSVRLRGFIAHDSLDYPPSRAARHRAVVAAGAERYPSYGQPQVGRDSRALHDRVAALEQFQSGEFAQLQKELRYLKARVAQAVRLHDRVDTLEKLAYAASSSSASHRG
ncbi:hypothetical protein PI125_g25743 [Phytophthora idaei]|nr:hypothetical protein PI125_g25743 [Phytophthora idaei]